MARGGHGLPEVSLGPAMPYPYTPCGQATPETAFSEMGRPQGGHLLPPWTPNAVRLCLTRILLSFFDILSSSDFIFPHFRRKPLYVLWNFFKDI
jgi:hypothetical protein